MISDPLTALLLETLGQHHVIPTKMNVAPTETIPVLRYESDWSLVDMRWWLVPSWSAGPSTKFSMFNARSESLLKSRAYREPFTRRRCVIPVSGYFEWRSMEGRKQPMYFTPADGAGLLLAALWDVWQGPEGPLFSCSIITAAAPPEMRRFHHRVPVQLSPAELFTWLDLDTSIHALEDLLQPELPAPLAVCDVSSVVNNARNKDERCLQAISEVEIIH